MFNKQVVLLIGAVVILSGCAYNEVDRHYDLPDTGVDALQDIAVRLVCQTNSCGTLVDKYSGTTTDCGECQAKTQCGDNNMPNVCGDACLPNLNNDGTNDTNACNFFYDSPAWGTRYGTQVQYPYACNYANPLNCEVAINPWPADGICSPDVCEIVWCCVSNPDAGTYPLLPGSVASSDAGID